MIKLSVVTTNDGKFREFSSALVSPGIQLERMNISYPEVQSDRLEDVVSFGIDWLSGRLSCSFVIDDSGIFIDHLHGFPGVFSAYALKSLGLNGIMKLMADATSRGAQFKTVLGLYHEGKRTLFEGVCKGSISTTIRGKGGFGYDPLFIPEGRSKTFAEMSMEAKKAISHRGRALGELRSSLENDMNY